MTLTASPEIRPSVAKAIEALKEAARGCASYHIHACVKCGLCGESCHIYLTDPTLENLPGYKASRIIRIFQRYESLTGRLIPFLTGARDLTPDRLNEIVDSVFGRCTGCGRCGLHCSIGLDIASVLRAGRIALASAGYVPRSLNAVVRNQIDTGNQMAITRDELIETARWLAGDLAMETGIQDIEIPIDIPGRRVLYLINPREVKFFPLSLMAAAGIFRAASESWTISSMFYDVTNYGFFAGDNPSAGELTRRVIEEAEKLKVEEIILSECGHGFRSFRWEGPNWLKKEYPVPMRSVLELFLEYLETGRIRVDKTKNTDRVTLHDPCNLVRWGGISEPQRKILARVVMDFEEMTPRREQNYCCGGGGGMLSMSEYGDRRVASGRLKAEQISRTGARIVATPCHNCADQLLEINKKYKLNVEIQSVSELIYNALIWDIR